MGGGKEAPRGEWEPRDAASAAERRRSPGGRGGGGGWRSAFPPRPVSPLGLSPRPVFPARGWRRVPTPRPLARLPCPPGLRPPAPRLPRGGRVEGLGRGARARARAAAAAFALGAGPSRSPRPHGALRRVSGRAARRRAPVAPSWGGSGPPGHPGGPQSLGSRGVPAGRRLPPPALDGSLSVRRTSALTLPSLPAPCLSPLWLPRPGLGPGFGSSPSPPPLSHPASRALPARAPLPAAAPRPLWREGPGFAGAGRDAVVGKRELWGAWGGRGVRSGPPPAAPVGGGKGWGRGRCRVSA